MKIIRVCALFWLSVAAPSYADVHLFEAAGITQIENIGALKQNQRAGLEKFAEGNRYFGAIFIEQGGSGWGSFTGANRLEDAFELARRICDKYADEGKCVLAGVTYPADMDTVNIPRNTLNKRASEKFGIYQGRTEGHRAFSVSGNTAFGWATRRDSLQEAIEAALTKCYASSMANLLKLEVDLRKQAIEDKFYTCTIIDSSAPDTPPS
ncbi:hypothetical protein K3757_06480 [Sulfitobacter sp. S223]|uniref:hypothetical protein n=1 Tax=Sulfitobacter sp. S223 TaxID=2867023 RepID=UPI0021A50B70|nr:hypothetical protein [Sulfitobacter sp. S223]UWR27574.1 hypothetical protein K3757_06480 [Sulfitobacter sp. S223]